MANFYTIQSCNAQNQYVLFNVNSTFRTKTWTRDDTSGRQLCFDCGDKCDLLKQKLKLTVLKNSNKFIQNSSKRQVSKTVPTNNTMITVGMIQYKLPCELVQYKTLIQELLVTQPNIKSVLQQVASQFNIQLNDLSDVPLSQYLTRYTYTNGGGRLNVQSPIQIQNSIIITSIIPPVNPILSISVPNHPEISLNFKYTYAIKFACNDGITYTTELRQLFPDGTASYIGSRILSTELLKPFYDFKNQFPTIPIPDPLIIPLYYNIIVQFSPLDAFQYGGNQFKSFGVISFRGNEVKQYVPFYPEQLVYMNNPYLTNTAGIITQVYKGTTEFIDINVEIDYQVIQDYIINNKDIYKYKLPSSCNTV
jgi:hypothetical protein